MPDRFPKIELTDEEWMSVINQERDGLPYCCANVSNVRDQLIGIARGDGDVLIPDRLRLAMVAYVGTHDWDEEVTPVMRRVIEQMGWSREELEDKYGQPGFREHEVDA